MKWNDPQILWPGVIIVLLLSSIVLMTSVIYFANSDGGAQVVENYYDKAVRWDERKNERAKFDAMDWEVTCDFGRSANDTSSLLSCLVSDSEESPVSGIDLNVDLNRPGLGFRSRFMLREKSPGQYDSAVGDIENGLWDLSLDGNYEGFEFQKEIRTELK